MLPLAELALKAHPLGERECRDGSPLDLLACLPGCFAGSAILFSGLIKAKQIEAARPIKDRGAPVTTAPGNMSITVRLASAVDSAWTVMFLPEPRKDRSQ